MVDGKKVKVSYDDLTCEEQQYIDYLLKSWKILRAMKDCNIYLDSSAKENWNLFFKNFIIETLNKDKQHIHVIFDIVDSYNNTPKMLYNVAAEITSDSNSIRLLYVITDVLKLNENVYEAYVERYERPWFVDENAPFIHTIFEIAAYRSNDTKTNIFSYNRKLYGEEPFCLPCSAMSIDFNELSILHTLINEGKYFAKNNLNEYDANSVEKIEGKQLVLKNNI